MDPMTLVSHLQAVTPYWQQAPSSLVIFWTAREQPEFTKPWSLGLSATIQQHFSLAVNQPPATSQQYSSLRTKQHQSSATSQPNRLQTIEMIKSQLIVDGKS
jgi:hypothetical protein